MNTEQSKKSPKAMVAVFEDEVSAVEAIKALYDAGFSTEKMELITHNLKQVSANVESQEVQETTSTSVIDGAEKWGAIGAGSGLAGGVLVAVLTGFPGIIIGTSIVGGLTGLFMGGMAGVEHAVEDDAVDLPTINDYKQLIQAGYQLVVTRGTHIEMVQAKDLISNLPQIHNHLHMIHGHEFHEHSAHEATE